MIHLWEKQVELTELVGKKIEQITGLEKDSGEVRIFTECGKEFMFYHEYDCCEQVYLTDFEVGSDDMSGATIISAEKSTNSDDATGIEYPESFTWTFYKIETSKGEIWMRWLGQSNGYYSESVDFTWVNKPEND